MVSISDTFASWLLFPGQALQVEVEELAAGFLPQLLTEDPHPLMKVM